MTISKPIASKDNRNPDFWYGPYESKSQVLEKITKSDRYLGQTVAIYTYHGCVLDATPSHTIEPDGVEEYWFNGRPDDNGEMGDDTLVEKYRSISILPDGINLVSFSGNGESGVMETQLTNAESLVQLPSNAFETEDDFNRWIVRYDGSDIYADEEEVIEVFDEVSVAYASFGDNTEINVCQVDCVSEPFEGGVVFGGGVYESSQNVTLMAVPYYGYRFTGWDGDEGSESDNVIEVQASNPVQHVARFARVQQNVTLNAGNDGQGLIKIDDTVTETTYDEVKDYGSVVKVEATPAEGFVFESWSDGVTEPVREIVVDGDIDVTAQFRPVEMVTLTVASSNPQYGNVSVEGHSGTSITVPKGSRVTIKAEQTGNIYVFKKWDDIDNDDFTSQTREITVDRDMTMTAVFMEFYNNVITWDCEHCTVKALYEGGKTLTPNSSITETSYLYFFCDPDDGYVFKEVSGLPADCMYKPMEGFSTGEKRIYVQMPDYDLTLLFKCATPAELDEKPQIVHSTSTVTYNVNHATVILNGTEQNTLSGFAGETYHCEIVLDEGYAMNSYKINGVVQSMLPNTKYATNFPLRKNTTYEITTIPAVDTTVFEGAVINTSYQEKLSDLDAYVKFNKLPYEFDTTVRRQHTGVLTKSDVPLPLYCIYPSPSTDSHFNISNRFGFSVKTITQQNFPKAYEGGYRLMYTSFMNSTTMVENGSFKLDIQ